MHKKLGRFHRLMINFDLAVLTISFLPFVLIIEKFVKEERRGNFWRKIACWIVRAVFKLNGVHFKIKHPKNILKYGTIYAANHPSQLDGFMLLSILGPNTILFVMPIEGFPLILKTWVRKMQAIDVRRDPIDDKKYPSGHSKKEAINLAIKHLKQGRNLIIFPEGHTEVLHVLHYFHTGPARISIGAHVPIIPVSIVNADQIFPDEHHVYPGTVLFTFGKQITPPTIRNNKVSYTKKQVQNLRSKFEKSIADKLPVRYLPNYYKQRDKSVGVFVDIDRTIYEGLSQKDLIAYLLWLHKIKAKEAFKVFYWLFMEKMNHIEHEDLMKKALLLLRGWDMAELHKYTHQAFEKKLIKKIQYGIFPLLKDHAEENHSIVLVSEAIHPLANEFKKIVHAKGCLDTKLDFTNHCYTGETNCLCYKERKAILVRNFAKRANINLNKSFAYADSHSDLPFLSLVKYPTAVNPDDKLLDYAIDHDWEVLLDAS